MQNRGVISIPLPGTVVYVHDLLVIKIREGQGIGEDSTFFSDAIGVPPNYEDISSVENCIINIS